jgi:hypothetical protein
MKITKEKLKQIIKEELSLVGEGGSLQNAAKSAAMELLDTAKTMEQAPSHDSASNYAQFVAKQANLIMDMLVQMEDGDAPERKKKVRDPYAGIGDAYYKSGMYSGD